MKKRILRWILIGWGTGLLLTGCQTPEPRPNPGVSGVGMGSEWDNVLRVLQNERDPDTGRLVPPRNGGGSVLPTTPGGGLMQRPNGNGAVYRLDKGDQMIIQLTGIPNEQRVDDVIDEYGNITVPLLDRIYVAGKTASEVEQTIQQAYTQAKIYKRITVNVMIPPKNYFIQGEVKQPAKYILSNDGMTLSQAIATAGGYTEYANKKKLQLTRRGKIININMETVEIDPKRDVAVEAGDIIRIPRGWL